MRPFFSIGLGLCFFHSQILADTADELVDYVYKASCCVNQHLIEHPMPEHPCDTAEKSGSYDRENCVRIQMEFTQMWRDQIVEEYCAVEALQGRKATDRCEKDFSKKTCHEAFQIGKSRAMRECGK